MRFHKAETDTLSASISIGTTGFGEEDKEYTGEVKWADLAMYQSRHRGKSMRTSLRK